jgi:hypothetical protein
VQHALLSKDLRGWTAWAPALAVVLATALTRNLAIGYAAGAGVYFALRGTRGWRRVALTEAEL